jgi:chromatin segregation and condensation protein Rec8/ScpA/Scc1 (kleisin family)
LSKVELKRRDVSVAELAEQYFATVEQIVEAVDRRLHPES